MEDIRIVGRDEVMILLLACAAAAVLIFSDPADTVTKTILACVIALDITCAAIGMHLNYKYRQARRTAQARREESREAKL